MPPKKKNTKHSQKQQSQPENPVEQIIQNVVQDFVSKATSTIPASTEPSQEVLPVEPTPKKKTTRKPRTTKKKDSSQEISNITDLNTSSQAVTQSQEDATPIKKRAGRKPKIKQQEIVTVKEETLEQQQQQHMTTTSTTTAAPQHQLLFINATPEEPVKKKPGRKPKAKKQEEAQQHIQPTPAIPATSNLRDIISLDEDSFPPYGSNKSEIKSEPQSNSNYNSPPAVPPPVVQPVSISAATPPPAASSSKRGRPRKAKVNSQTVNAAATSDITESHDAKAAPTRKRKPRKQEVPAELDKQSEIVAGETFVPQEKMDLQQQQQQQEEGAEQPIVAAKAANPTKRRRTKKRDTATTLQIASSIETSIEQPTVQNEQQPPIKTTRRGRPKKIKSNDTVAEKSDVSEKTVTIKTEKVSDTESKSSEPQELQQKLSANEPSEQQKHVDSTKLSMGPKNSSVVLNEDVEMSEHQEQENPSVSIKSQTIDRDEDTELNNASENDNNFQTSVLQEQDVTMEVTQNKEEEATVNSSVGEQSVKRKRSLVNSDSDGEDGNQPTLKKLSLIEDLKAKKEKFNKLRSRMDEGESANRKEVYEEYNRKKTNPKEMIRQERKREEAENLLAKQQAEERGEDYERLKFWEYSAESVEKWEKKQEKKAKKSDVAFTDYNQVAHKKYKKQINELKPDLVTYNEQKGAAMASSSLITTEDGQIVSVDTESNFYRDANSLQYASVDNQPSREAIDKVVADVNKTIAKREKSSRQKTVNDDDDITYINERNRRFNEKIGRFYDKYTKEIKENFERGTAL